MGISKLSCICDYQEQVSTLETSGGQNTMSMQKQLCLKGGFLSVLTHACASDTSWAFALLLPRSCLPRNEEVILLVSNGLINGLTISRIYLICLQLLKNDC